MKQSMPIRIFNKAPAVPTVDDQHWYKITAAVKAEGDDEGEPAPSRSTSMGDWWLGYLGQPIHSGSQGG